MIVYADRKRRMSTRILAGDWRDTLIRFGELEAAVADSLCPDFDEPHPLLERLRSIAIRIGGGDPYAVQEIPPLPPDVYVSVPEGYAYYAVYPEDYGKAALRFFQEARPQKAVVIGIRSIGTSLSAVVAATLQRAGCAVKSFTVRPRGHPFDRRLLLRQLEWDGGAHFLIVDEGPGLSGSSFACVAEYLSNRGIADDRIVFFPSWETDGRTLRSEGARKHWTRHRKYTEARGPMPDSRDLSAGKWREVSVAAPPVQPQHERRKYLRDGRLYKFEGLGHYGDEKFQRAKILSDAGLTPRPFSLENGYLISEWVAGRPASTPETTAAAWIARYLEFLQLHFPSDRPVPYQHNMEMIRVNVEEGLGPEWTGCLAALEQFQSLLCDRPTTELDGRMQPHELLSTSVGYLKTDALDHYDDHFYPGCQDIAWDAASLSLEFGISQIEDIAPAACLSFYRIAYLSYRLGYCTMAADSGYDTGGFRSLANQYREMLRNELGGLCRS